MTTRTVGYLTFFLAAYLARGMSCGYLHFVIELALALLLEPVVRFLSRQFRLKRAAAAALLITGLIARSLRSSVVGHNKDSSGGSQTSTGIAGVY